VKTKVEGRHYTKGKHEGHLDYLYEGEGHEHQTDVRGGTHNWDKDKEGKGNFVEDRAKGMLLVLLRVARVRVFEGLNSKSGLEDKGNEQR